MIIDKLKLPSNGLLGVPKEINVKALTGRELNMIYSSLSDASVNEVIKRITEPQMDPDLLCDEDKGAILYFSRLLTFGENIDQFFKCPHCGQIHKQTVRYSDLTVNYLEEFDSVIELGNGDKVYKRVPTQEIQNEINQFKEKNNIDAFDSYLLYLLARIEKVVTPNEIINNRFLLFNYLGDLHGKEFAKIMDNIEVNFGLDVTFRAFCPNTKLEFVGVVGINADFFRESNNNLSEGISHDE